MPAEAYPPWAVRDGKLRSVLANTGTTSRGGIRSQHGLDPKGGLRHLCRSGTKPRRLVRRPSIGRRICLAIGISDAPPLDYLPGAVNGARAISEWAAKAGYETQLLTDEVVPVGVDAIVRAMANLMPHGSKSERLLIYFAGHGLARDAAEDLWLLSQWYDQQRAVAVGGLKRKLERYGIDQIAIFSDACRSLPPDADAADLTPDNVLGRGPYDATLPLVDMLKASSKYRAAYMIPGEGPEDDRCIFTGMIEEALWGRQDIAFDPDRRVEDKRCVTSASLAKYLRREVPVKAQYYQVELRPDIISGFLSPDDVYVTEALAGAPPPKDWPPVTTTGAMGTASRTASIGKRGWSTAVPRNDAREPQAEADEFLVFEMVREMRTTPRRPLRPRPRPRPRESREMEQERIQKEALSRESRLSGYLAGYEQEERPRRFETHCGFSLSGATVKRALLGPGATAKQDDRNPKWWRVEERKSPIVKKAFPLLIELDDSRWLGAAAMPGFILTLTVDDAGTASAIYRNIRAGGAAAQAEEAVARLRAGMVDAAAAFDYAAELRVGKHLDPLLGVLAAYLYDAQGDVDSIRQIAFYYVNAGQPIPFDIAMLARVKAKLRKGELIVNLPAVRARAPRTETEARHDWTYRATGPATGPVAGAFPWLRQGWSFVDDDDAPLTTSGSESIRKFLSPAPFTTLSHLGGKRLAQLIFGDNR